MKKLLILSILLILGISLVAYAGATKYELIPYKTAGDNTSGWVIVNTNPQKMILEFQVDGLPVDNNQEYWAYYYNYDTKELEVLGQLKVNKFGSGHLNAHVSEGISENFQVGVANCENMADGDVTLYVIVPLP
jgi:hypothetical protein